MQTQAKHQPTARIQVSAQASEKLLALMQEQEAEAVRIYVEGFG